LPDDTIAQLQDKITLHELRTVVSTMNSNAAPGAFGMELGCI
jgi:hypothetical protein